MLNSNKAGVLFIFMLLLIPGLTLSQNLSGKWEGSLQQTGSNDVYFYEMVISVDGEAVSGTSSSRSEDGKSRADFILSGIWDGDKLVLQEVKQTAPEQPKWCLKSMTLIFKSLDAGFELNGNWTAKGCKPGTAVLKKMTTIETEIKEEAFSMLGKWTGNLSQSDRGYGFYYELNLERGGVGTSFIVSEGNGGSATHSLTWIYDEAAELLTIKEYYVTERTREGWKWCIKSGTLKLKRVGMSYFVEGDWSGYIEEKDPELGACAPGHVILEKPVLTKEIKREINAITQPYEEQNKRVVKVGRTVEVSSKNVKIKIWDSGTVDGDYATLFLNGERILNNYRVQKYKKGIPVELNGEENLLILHAEDLGKIPPNTVAVSVVDGKKETVIILNSNLKESDAILIRRFKLKE